jgi:uncharacterized protein (TIGR02466 family)
MVSAVITEEFALAFPTLIWHKVVGTEQLNTDLLALIRQKQADSPGVKKSNVGGWHSETDLLEWESPGITALTAGIHSALKQYYAFVASKEVSEFQMNVRGDAWANVNTTGASNKLHVHPSANISGVYYVDAGNAVAPDSGRLEFLDPRNRPNMFETAGTDRNDWFCMAPKSGLLVLFPSWLYHAVTPYDGARDRVSIAFNFTVTKIMDPEGNALKLT